MPSASPEPIPSPSIRASGSQGSGEADTMVNDIISDPIRQMDVNGRVVGVVRR